MAGGGGDDGDGGDIWESIKRWRNQEEILLDRI